MTPLLPEVTRFLSSRPLKQFWGGQWFEASSGRTFEVRDPGDDRVSATVEAGDAPDVDRAVEAAQAAFRKPGWADLPANDRAVLLHRLADVVERHREVLAQL